jgi:serine/threonine protein kinase
MAIFAQLALALRHVHDLRILHRDVKSQNVFLTSGCVVKLGDFGVAKKLAASEVCAATRIGTPQCVPPEICEDHPYDFKADVWGLGVVLYQLLALECPFHGASFAALAVRICTAEPRPVPTCYSPEARVLVSRLLSKRAEDRPSSAEILVMPHVRRSVMALPSQQTPRLSARAASARPTYEVETSHHSLARADSLGAQPLSPLRVLRRRAANAIRRAATVPDGNLDIACKARKGVAVPKIADFASPQKAKGASPKKSQTFREWASPKKARVLKAPHGLAALVPIADEQAAWSPGSKGSVSDLLAFFLESPVGASSEQPLRSSGSDDELSTRAATHDGGSSRSGAGEAAADAAKVAEDLASCTGLLSALEREFGLA